MWAPYKEIEFSRIATPPAVLPSQFAHAIRWVPLQFDEQPLLGFERSHDLFGDGSLAREPMAGRPPGSVGLFLALDDGRRFFFTGDTGAWRGSPGRRRSSGSANAWSTTTRRALQQLEKAHCLLREPPQLVVVPAHGEAVQRGLGYYPQWIE